MRRGPWLAAPVLAVSVLVLTACASGGTKSSGPTWVPQPAYTLEPGRPDTGGSAGTGSSSAPGSNGSTAPSQPGQTPTTDPAVVATGLAAPIGIAILPSGNALVGQRVSGTIVQVQPTAGMPVTTVRTVPGLDASGDGGLLDLALSPSYAEDHLIYAYVTTATDNRVVDFTLNGPITPVLTGIPKGPTGNGGRIAFGVDGSLLVGTGDAGQPALAQNPASLAGKVLEVTDVGAPVAAGSPVLTEGHSAVAGLCIDPDTASVFETEPSLAATPSAAASRDEVNLLTRGGDYGWPVAGPTSVAPLATLPAGANGQLPVASGCAVANGVLYVASLDATTLYAADIAAHNATAKVGSFVASLAGQYGRLITVVADPDGSLWLATANAGVTPSPAGASATSDDRILHIQPSGGGAGSTV
jgi:glucose/arabinose dehydrogenase